SAGSTCSGGGARAGGWRWRSRVDLPHDRVEILERNPHRRAVRAVVDARGTAVVGLAQVALRRDVDELSVLRLGDGDDVSPRTPVRAVPAADARVGDRDLKSRADARDGAGRATDHADRIRAVVAGGRDEEVLVLRSLADEPRRSAVRRLAPSDAVVAASAGVE